MKESVHLEIVREHPSWHPLVQDIGVKTAEEHVHVS